MSRLVENGLRQRKLKILILFLRGSKKSKSANKKHATVELKNETSPVQTKKDRTLINHSSVDKRVDTNLPKDIVIQPDLPPRLEEHLMSDAMHEIEDDSDYEADNDNTVRSIYNSSQHIAITPTNTLGIACQITWAHYRIQ